MFVLEGLAEAGLVIAELAFKDGKVLPEPGHFRTVAVGQAFEGVEDGAGAVMVA